MLRSDLDLTAEVDAEHALDGHNHIDCVTRAPLCQTYAIMHTMGVLVWSHDLLGCHGDAQ